MMSTEWPDESQRDSSSDISMPELLVTPGQMLVDQFNNQSRIWAILINQGNQLLVSLADSQLTTGEASKQSVHYPYSAILQRMASGFYQVVEEFEDIALTLPPPGAVIFRRTSEGPLIKVARVMTVHWQVKADVAAHAVVGVQRATDSRYDTYRATHFYRELAACGWLLKWTEDMLLALDPGLSAGKHL